VAAAQHRVLRDVAGRARLSLVYEMRTWEKEEEDAPGGGGERQLQLLRPAERGAGRRAVVDPPLAVDPLAASAFALLDKHSGLRLVTDAVHEDDALCLALTCRALRDALWVRFPAWSASDAHAGARVRTRDAAVVGTAERLAWARGLDRAWPGPREDWHLDQICEIAALHGALASLQWARANGCKWSARTCSTAAQGGYLAVLQWAWANGCEWDEDTRNFAAAGGHLAVLQWARANGCGWKAATCCVAAAGGHLAVLQWLRANGCDWDANTCMMAAARGHLAVLQWARANGCGWNATTCCVAAARGHLVVLQWARANGCGWNANTCSEAAAGGHLAVLQWLRANGCGWDANTCSEAAKSGHLVVLQWARDNGCGWDRAHCLLQVVQGSWAAENTAVSETREWIQAQPA
jgi:hypothetical protein